MADTASLRAPLCTEQFGSGAPRSCSAAADGSLQWDRAQRWGWFSRASITKPGQHEGGGRGPWAALTTLSGLRSVLLPQGFPDSVSPDYLQYQLWDSVQAFASSLSGSLATQAVLQGLGVGNAKASVSAATSTWLVKDSTGMLGRIIFAWWKGSKLDCNAKQWRLFADILNDTAMFLEIMAPMYPIFFTMTVSTSNLAKCIVGVAGGATRAALTMHQARRNNMADVSAKDSSQETVVNLAGLLVSLLMLPLVSDCLSLSLGCFILLTALHIYANYRAVRALVLETLNESRLQLVLKHFLQRGEVLEPASANQMEPLWTGFWPSLSLSLGVPLHHLVSSVSELKQLVEGHQEPYLLCWNQSQNQVQVALSQVAGPETVLRAATHGLILGALQEDGPLPGELAELRDMVQAGPKNESWILVRETHQVLDTLFPKFLKGLQAAGWKTEKHHLEVDEWRATWPLSPEKKVL
ncbi:RUS family member 1 [Rattus norvegicus]|uniref:RUS family member 1 n=1 Tax=Rattus norvegicus TaxID=10116 RepID=RUSF1_RAT|nr:RUS family member 1 [Rattus norvegicus]Q499P8.1 RecName: Full=RUS family member 1 [Rattus norvegicus]AAH99813.1 Similar to cDNA sequence BC017158 [Rattus norvegicus]|eukprot:NP_001030594.1 RUS1 family protein C16orf58 homolog [Rattus norvegicus]